MLGIEGSTAYTDIEGNGRQPSGPVSFRNYINADLRARAGYAFGSYLPFVSAGFAYGRSEQIDTATGSQLGRVNNEAIEAGAGLDYRISERVSLRGEYLHEFGINNKVVNLNNTHLGQAVDRRRLLPPRRRLPLRVRAARRRAPARAAAASRDRLKNRRPVAEPGRRFCFRSGSRSGRATRWRDDAGRSGDVGPVRRAQASGSGARPADRRPRPHRGPRRRSPAPRRARTRSTSKRRVRKPRDPR